MHNRRQIIATAAALAAAGPAFAQDPAPKPPVRVALTTALGVVVIELAPSAPVSTANYLRYVDRKLYDGAAFYRASRPPGSTANDYGLVQGGLQNDPKKVLAPIAHESTRKTGLTHKDGTISMGRHAPGSAQADWFICLGDQAYLDADPKDPKSAGFAAFGQVVEGMEVIKQILVQPVSPTAGEGSMKGEMLVRPVRILTARRAS
ncbi:peptidylprolyl isomerase [Phenylobacterium sp.]|uniref:peptidylprolyl isomerase n=1 Tax=Phenylobacterium sp. TaxID=1871053 RepID=UPI003982DD60